jgi:hypothetical protein
VPSVSSVLCLAATIDWCESISLEFRVSAGFLART